MEGILCKTCVQNIMPQPAAKGRRLSGKHGLRSLIKKYEADVIAEALLACEGDHEMAAGLLRIHKATLYKKLKTIKGG